MPPTKRVARPAPREDEDTTTEDTTTEDTTTEEEQEQPRRRKAMKAGDSPIRGGWTGGQQVADSTSSYAQTLKLEEKTKIIKFLQDEPYASYRRHWIEQSGPTGKTLRSYACLVSFDADCPLCEAGDKATATVAFNVAEIGDDGVPTLKTWDAGVKIFKALQAYANDPKVAPLTRGYFLVGRSGKKGSVNYTINPVKPSSLEEDYDIEPPDKAALERLGLYDTSIIERPKLKTLEELAVEIADEY